MERREFIGFFGGLAIAANERSAGSRSGLTSYGSDLRESFERTAYLVDRIFKGASPGDLPFEQPTPYLFVINLKTAKSMGLEIPPTLLPLADEVVE